VVDDDRSLSATPDEPRWLSREEQDAWSALVAMLLLLPGRLDGPLQAATGLTTFEYLVLSHTSEAPGRRLRMSELAALANGSLSRLSNVVKRLERRGWMQRQPDPSNGRYTIASLTEQGWEVVVGAAPTHVASVRHVLLDRLNGRDQADLIRLAARLGAHIT